MTAPTDPRDAVIEAARPFAAAADDLDHETRDRDEIWELPVAMSITAGDLRRIRCALAALDSAPADDTQRRPTIIEEGVVKRTINPPLSGTRPPPPSSQTAPPPADDTAARCERYRVALQNLTAEIGACLSLSHSREALRDAVGNTNLAVLDERLAQAEDALAMGGQ